MDDLKAWMMAKLLWNSNADPKVVRDDFLNGYYGKAGKIMGQYIDLLEEKVRKDNIHGGIYTSIDDNTFLTDDVMAKCNKLFDKAESVVTGEELARVKHTRLSMRCVEVYRQCKAARTGTDMQKISALKALRIFKTDCEEDGVDMNTSEGRFSQWCEKLAAPLR